MKNKILYYILGLFALGCVALATNPANAATAAGPYYALPSWDQQLPSATRFIVLSNWGSAAVLDRETGLVWEQSPSTAIFSWITAHGHCNNLTVGNRKGWRLPTIQELASLIGTSVAPPGPTLPADHPFSNVQSASYWSATTFASNATWAWDVRFDFGDVYGDIKSNHDFVWCVRGGQGHDAQ